MPSTALGQQQGIYVLVANLFDQFDAPEGANATNPYDRFDAAPAPQSDSFRAPADLAIGPYNPTILDRTRNLIQPLADILTKLSTVPQGMPQIPRVPEGAL